LYSGVFLHHTMKELITRGIFGIVFLLFVFLPFFVDLSNHTHLFNLVLYTFSLFSTYELFKIGANTATKSPYLIPALLLNTVLFLPLLIETAKSIYPQIPSIPMWHFLCQPYVVHIGWIIVLLSIIAFIILIYQKKSIEWIFQYTFPLSILYVMIPLFLLGVALTQSPTEIKQLLFIVLLPIYLNDTFAYLSGRLFGKHKMFPTVSPKKTWEGFIGGVIGAAVVMNCLLAFNKTTFTTYKEFIALTLISFSVSILATYGDLFESKLKRATGVKDSGKILPGHGGVLDRIDAMLFAAPVLYVLLALY
jgi:phosphatidate cytidylyltransferase